MSALLELLQETLVSLEIPAQLAAAHVDIPDGIRLEAEGIETYPLDNGGVRTSTSITARHVLFPDGLMEFQHTVGADEASAYASGFLGWAHTDLVVLRDAVKVKPEYCNFMSMDFPGGRPARQVLLGPPTHYRSAPNEKIDETHPFCPCCLFANSIQAFDAYLKSSELLGIRLFASRDNEGICEADCRVNGKDFPDALACLVEYAQTWPAQGFEFRKQYVVIRDKPVE